jgi:NMD protein affecting ribosome stability and mRNA decay
MRCYICNKETNNFEKDPDGKWISICSQCRGHVFETKRIYRDIDEDDLRVLKMSAKDFEKEMEDDIKK